MAENDKPAATPGFTPTPPAKPAPVVESPEQKKLREDYEAAEKKRREDNEKSAKARAAYLQKAEAERQKATQERFDRAKDLPPGVLVNDSPRGGYVPGDKDAPGHLFMVGIEPFKTPAEVASTGIRVPGDPPFPWYGEVGYPQASPYAMPARAILEQYLWHSNPWGIPNKPLPA